MFNPEFQISFPISFRGGGAQPHTVVLTCKVMVKSNQGAGNNGGHLARETLLRGYRSARELVNGLPETERLRSAVCMTCGACCFSQVIPIDEDDFNGFYERLGLGLSRAEFASMFLQENGVADSGKRHIETARYGGRCMFLGKRGTYGCAVWGLRPAVCEEFHCWELTCFMKWLGGGDQDMFHGGAENMESNLAILLEKLVLDSPLSVFPEDAANYARVAVVEFSPGFYERRPYLFNPEGPAGR